MGPFQSQQSKPPQNSNQNGQVEQHVINHPKFKNFKIIKSPTEQEQGIIEITLPLANQAEFKNWTLKLKRFGEAQNIFLPLNQKFLKTQFCGSAGLCTAQYKYYPYLLSDEIVNRRSMQGKHFQEPELWYLIYCMLQAAKKFHQFGEKLGDIRPENIFISPDGQVAVATQYTWPGERTNFQITALQRELTYLSPQQLKDISYGKLEQSPNFSINQSFSIGLTCLDAATLSESIKLYENNNKFNYHKLQEKLEQLEQSAVYTQPLILIIQGLCQVDSQKRANCKQLVEWLQNYQQSIVELTPFTVKELPDKLSILKQQKSKESKNNKAQPFVNSINHGTIYNSTLVKPQARYVEHSQPLIRQEDQKYVVQQNYFQSVPQNRTYVNSVNFNQVGTHTIAPNSNIGVSGFNGPPPIFQTGYNEAPSQNTNPSTITFQNDVNRTNYGYISGNSQLRSNLNLQQIDEQLQMSRKLFPS